MKFFARILIIFCCCCYVLPIWAQQSKTIRYTDEEKQKVKTKQKKTDIACGIANKMRVAGFVTNPPFGWVNIVSVPGGKITYKNEGFSYDLFTKIAKKHNLKVDNIGYTSYQEAMKDLRRGRIDVIVGTYYDKRVLGSGTNLLFPSYISNPIIPIFVKGKERPVKTWEDLRGLKGIVRQEEMIYSLVYQQLPKDLDIHQVAGARKAFTALITGEVDYMLTSLYAAEAEVRRFKLVDEIYFTPTPLVSPELFVVFSSHSDCRKLKPLFTEALKKEKSNQKAFFNQFVGYIDMWGQRFKNDPSLIDEIKAARSEKKEELVEPDEPVDMSTPVEEMSGPDTEANKAALN